VNPAAAIRTYAVSQEDLNQVGPLPTPWIEKSKVSRLPYPSLDQALAERFHCSRALLAELNPGMDIAHLQPGTVIRAPAVEAWGRFSPQAEVAAININFSQKAIRLYSSPDCGRVVGLLHCSIAKDKAKLPSGKARVVVISPNPTYGFDPAMWPEVKGVTHKLMIPPGPRNPVGMCWVGLNLKGYGIHGTPAPELIGKTGSHGCIRLANWDAVRLGRTVKAGTPVSFSM
jgi:lipoprotein-anchoring transpeptidase ErfK/SrfK